MPPYTFKLADIELDIAPPVQAVRLSGGGRAVQETFSINGTALHSAAYRTARRVQVASPDPAWVILAAQAEAIRALAESGNSFTVVLGSDYQPSGTFTGCLFDGDVLFEAVGDPAYANYSFTLYLPQEA